MRTGAILSGLGHAAVILAAVVNLPWLRETAAPPLAVTEVSFITAEEFERAASGVPAEPEPTPAPAPEPEPEPAPPDVVEPAPAPAPETAPEEPPAEEVTLAPAFDPLAPLGIEEPAAEAPPPAPGPLVSTAPPLARPSPRVITVPSPPAPDVAADEAPSPEVIAAPEAESAAEERPAATPEPPAPEPEPEPEPLPEVAAAPPTAQPLATSSRPVPRPRTLARPVETARAAEEDDALLAAIQAEVEREITARQAQSAQATPPTPPTVTEPSPATPAPAAPAPQPSTGGTAAVASGPPLTQGERDGLKFAIQQCWNVPAGLRDAQELRVTVAAEIAADGQVIAGSIRMIEPASPPDGRYDAAFRAARSALIRCSPYTDLPRDKYAQWRNLEVVFNPEGMVSW